MLQRRGETIPRSLHAEETQVGENRCAAAAPRLLTAVTRREMLLWNDDRGTARAGEVMSQTTRLLRPVDDGDTMPASARRQSSGGVG